MKNSDKKVLVIGNGVWGLKVFSILQSYSSYSVENISARNFIQDFKIKTLNIYEIIWICTTNPLQLNLVSYLLENGFNGNLYIEKPFYNELEIEKLLSLKRDSKGLRISKPWNSSVIWLKSRQLMKDDFSNNKIFITRNGANRRIYITPVQDWLFHDLMLLNDLAEFVGHKLVVESQVTSSTDWCEIICEISGVPIALSGGFSETKKASWEVQQNNNKIQIDFNNLRIDTEIDSKVDEFKIDPATEHPLIRMLEDNTKKTQNLESFKAELLLINLL